MASSWGKPSRSPRAKLGGVVLGVGFANITALGLPLLEHLYGPMARAIIVHLDIFSSLPMVLTLGLMIARHYGDSMPSDRLPLKPLLQNPPLLRAGLAGVLKSASIELPSSVQTFLEPLAEAPRPPHADHPRIVSQWGPCMGTTPPLGWLS